MKKLFYSLMTLAAALTVTSCLKEVEGGSAAYDDGSLVDATFSVTLGPQTKAFADGTTVDKLYAGIYEIGEGPAYTHVWHTTSPIGISEMKATVTASGQLHRGKDYRVVFWAQKNGALYTIDWATAATTGPIVTVSNYSTGEANDEKRDAFYGSYDVQNVQANVVIAENDAIQLKRPFAQVNVLVPIDNITDPSGKISSTMTVQGAPTVLNLATKATSVPGDWSFASAEISEEPFGAYKPEQGNPTHKYVAMNYVLVDQLVQPNTDPRYNVGFTVSASAGAQLSGDKSIANVPLKPNGRTNIVGNVFANDFDMTVPVIIGPTPDTDEVLTLTTVTVTVGQTAAEAVELTYNPTDPASTSIEVAVSHPVEVEADKPQITVEPATVATAEWNLTTGKLDVTPLVANGNAVITLVFPAVTKTAYSAATVQVYVKVGNGKNEEQEQVATPTFDPAEGAVASGTAITIATTTPGATIYYTMGENPADPTTSSTPYDPDDKPKVTAATTIKAIAVKGGMENSAVATAAYTISAPVEPVATPTFDPAEGAVASGTAITIATTTPGATIYYTMGENPADPTTSSTPYDPDDKPKVTAATTIKAIAVKGGMENSEVATAVYTIKQPTTLFLETFGDNGDKNTLVASATTYTATTSMFTDPTSSTVVSHYLSDGKVGKGTLNVSTGYSNASGFSAVFYQAGAGDNTANLFTVDKIDISSATEISISFGLFYTNGNIGTTSTITAYYTVDDGSEKTLSFTQPASTNTWTLCTKSISETGNSLKIRFELVTTGGFTVRIDDIKVTGTK